MHENPLHSMLIDWFVFDFSSKQCVHKVRHDEHHLENKKMGKMFTANLCDVDINTENVKY